MAINFPAAAFLAGLKVPNQIMYCIQDSSGATPVVVYKDSQNTQQTVPWSNQETVYSQPKEAQQINGVTGTSQPHSIRVETGNQVSFPIAKT